MATMLVFAIVEGCITAYLGELCIISRQIAILLIGVRSLVAQFNRCAFTFYKGSQFELTNPLL